MPVYTGPDTATTTRMWRFMRKDFGTNLNSSIQSVALYVDTDNGAQTVYIDNIVACKASSAADSITHDSLVGLKTSTDWPNYYLINSIINENSERINNSIITNAVLIPNTIRASDIDLTSEILFPK